MPTYPKTPVHHFTSQPFPNPSAPAKPTSPSTKPSFIRKALMPTFSKRPYPTAERLQTIGARYRRLLNSHPFVTFGLPFILVMVAGSFFLTPATAVRYEKHDRRTHMLDRDEALGLNRVREAGKKKGKTDIREEYWRLAGRENKLDDWEPKRVKRLPGEPDGTFE